MPELTEQGGWVGREGGEKDVERGWESCCVFVKKLRAEGIEGITLDTPDHNSFYSVPRYLGTEICSLAE